jgi:hypothetical protein
MSDDKCIHEVDLSPEEEEAMKWLCHLLGDMANTCNPVHIHRALAAHSAVSKMFVKLQELLDLVHVQERQLIEADILLADLTYTNTTKENLN